VLLLAAAVVLSLISLAEVLLDPAGTTSLAASTALAVGAAACVALAAVTPVGALLLSLLAFPAAVALDLPGLGGGQLIVLLLLMGVVGAATPTRTAAALSVVGTVVSAGALVADGEDVWEFLFFGVLFGGATAVGVLLRREAERSAQLTALAAELAAEREARARDAVAEERTRIARELHDAVAHTVSVMVLQVGVVRHRLADRPVEHEVLLGVERIGRQAGDELRRTLGVLRPGGPEQGHAPQPSLRRLDELLDPVRAAGLRVRVEREGELGPLPPGLDVSAYRVLQEALTNVLRHAGPTDVVLRLTSAGGALDLVVEDAGPRAGRPAESVAGSGHGLVGMRERVAVYAGELQAGPRPGGGWAVRARLPLPAVPTPRGASA
jgi:signal transduction histidine kinase